MWKMGCYNNGYMVHLTHRKVIQNHLILRNWSPMNPGRDYHQSLRENSTRPRNDGCASPNSLPSGSSIYGSSCIFVNFNTTFIFLNFWTLLCGKFKRDNKVDGKENSSEAAMIYCTLPYPLLNLFCCDSRMFTMFLPVTSVGNRSFYAPIREIDFSEAPLNCLLSSRDVWKPLEAPVTLYGIAIVTSRFLDHCL